MSDSLAARLGLGVRELVAFVGAGGKSTLLFRLGNELAAAGAQVLLTTTTKMGSDQAAQVSAVGIEDLVEPAPPGPVMLISADDGHKVTGPTPERIDAIFADGRFDYVLVEADGARGRSFKTPAAHEPVIPATATVVVIVVGVDAIGRPIAKACHRPHLVARLAGVEPTQVLDVETAAEVLLHPHGFRQAIPPGARLGVAITKVAEATRPTAERLADSLLGAHDPRPFVALVASSEPA